MSIIHDPALYQLRHALRGYVYDPGEPEYEEACTLFNGMIERGRATSRAARTRTRSPPRSPSRALRDLRVAVRGGGHSVAGLSLVEDGLVIDVRGLREIIVDPERRVVRVGGGLTWAEVDAATQEHGLATVGGRVSSTGVAGLALGGGSGWLERKHGLACDNMLAVELVTARGEPVRATADEHPELFWALRGGGGNFGVVTAIELALHPVGPEVLGGLVLHPRERARELLRRFRDVMHDAPDELSLAYVFLTAPDEDGIPEALRGRPPSRSPACTPARSPTPRPRSRRCARSARPRSTRSGPRPTPTSSPRSTTRPAIATGGRPSTSRTSARTPSTRSSRSATSSRPGPRRSSSPPGAARSRACPRRTPLTGRSARFVVHPLLLWEDAADDERTIAYGRRWREVLAPYRTGAHLPQLHRRRGRGPRPRRLRAALRAARAREGGVGPGQRVPRHRQRANRRLGKPLMCSRPRAGSIRSRTSPRSPGASP